MLRRHRPHRRGARAAAKLQRNKPQDDGVSKYQTMPLNKMEHWLPLNKVEDFGLHCKEITRILVNVLSWGDVWFSPILTVFLSIQYHSMDITYLKAFLDSWGGAREVDGRRHPWLHSPHRPCHGWAERLAAGWRSAIH
jgi:hypothetical protein